MKVKDYYTVEDGIRFQRKLIAFLHQNPHLDTPGARDPSSGEMLTAPEYFDRQATVLAVLCELEQKFDKELK